MAGIRVPDVARRLNVSEKTVYKWLRQGLIPASRIGKTWIITEDSLNAVLNPASLPNQPSSAQSAWPVGARPPASETFRGPPGHGSPAPGRQQLFDSWSQISEIVNGAVAHGISGILGPRRLDPATPAAIASELESASGEILLQGVGLREFFGDRDHTVILRRMAAEDRSVSIRAILVNPTGQFARARTVVEDGEQFTDDALFRSGPLFGDSWRSLNVISSLKKASRESKRFRLDVRFVDHWPSTYLVHTANCAFVETYHFGRADSAPESGTIDGLVPMIRVAAGSGYYKLLRNHFDYLWNGKNPFVPAMTMEQIAEQVQV